MILLLLPLILLFSGCATTYVGEPTIPVFSKSVLTGWEGKSIQISVIDQRFDKTNKINIVRVIIEILKEANKKVEWQIISDTDLLNKDKPFLIIKVITYEATFTSKQWTGHVKFDIESNNNILTIGKSVTGANIWGYGSAEKVLQKAFEKTMEELISKL